MAGTRQTTIWVTIPSQRLIKHLLNVADEDHNSTDIMHAEAREVTGKPGMMRQSTQLSWFWTRCTPLIHGSNKIWGRTAEEDLLRQLQQLEMSLSIFDCSMKGTRYPYRAITLSYCPNHADLKNTSGSCSDDEWDVSRQNTSRWRSRYSVVFRVDVEQVTQRYEVTKIREARLTQKVNIAFRQAT
jgi:hypothetical protein